MNVISHDTVGDTGRGGGVEREGDRRGSRDSHREREGAREERERGRRGNWDRYSRDIERME